MAAFQCKAAMGIQSEMPLGKARESLFEIVQRAPRFVRTAVVLEARTGSPDTTVAGESVDDGSGRSLAPVTSWTTASGFAMS